MRMRGSLILLGKPSLGVFPRPLVAEPTWSCSYKRYNHCVTPYLAPVAAFDASTGRNQSRGNTKRRYDRITGSAIIADSAIESPAFSVHFLEAFRASQVSDKNVFVHAHTHGDAHYRLSVEAQGGPPMK